MEIICQKYMRVASHVIIGNLGHVTGTNLENVQNGCALLMLKANVVVRNAVLSVPLDNMVIIFHRRNIMDGWCPICNMPYSGACQNTNHIEKVVAVEPMVKPLVVCLCGSTRFTEQMLIRQWELTKQGIIVLSWCALPDSYFAGQDKTHVGDQEGVKEIVDEVHKRKIDLSSIVEIINIGGYIGESTRSELNYAIKHGKQISYWEEI